FFSTNSGPTRHQNSTSIAECLQNRLWPADDGGASRRSQIMLQMHEHTDGSSSFSEQIVLSQLAPPKWQRTSDRKQPVTVEMSKTLLPSTQTSAPTAAETPHFVAEHGPATRDSFIDSIPRAHVIPQPQIARQPPTLEEHEVPASARNAQHRPNLRPPLILSPQHCAQIKHYANMYAIVDVKKWVSRNCSFAKMYLPNATCDEINILVASCNL
ncbi:unnamed protein product, partial [Toxocara canis]|uniref:ULP_PROTEASE domain-containing protein n=1 Tax=Toxocara canis TaxID=6265 RepID=A0A183UVB3_TOXCA